MNGGKSKKVAILIPSCDNYSDLWELLSVSYKRFWPNCPYNIYIISNSEKQIPENFIGINVGNDVNWSSNAIKAIGEIQEDYILIHIDDLILSGEVDNNKLSTYIDNFIEQEGNYLKLLDVGNKRNKKLNLYSKTDSYRTSTIFSLWKKEILLDILKPGESPRSFEVNGTKRSVHYDKWFSVGENCIQYENLVIKGIIESGALRKLKGVGLDYVGSRERMSTGLNIKHNLECFIYTMILKLPNRLSIKLINSIRNIKTK